MATRTLFLKLVALLKHIGAQQETVVLMVDQVVLEDQRIRSRMRLGVGMQGSKGVLCRKEKG